MSNFFAEGGFGMLPTLAFGVLQVAVALVYAFVLERRLVSVAAVLGGVTLLSGSLGLTLGAVTTFLYVSKLPESQQYATLLVGLAESLHNLALALGLVVLGTLALAVGALRAALAARPERN